MQFNQSVYRLRTAIGCSTGTEVGKEFPCPAFQGASESCHFWDRGIWEVPQNFLCFASTIARVVSLIRGTQILSSHIRFQNFFMAWISGNTSLQSGPLAVGQTFDAGA